MRSVLANKFALSCLVVGLVILLTVVLARGGEAEQGDGVTVIPHEVGWGFDNCLACHTGGLHGVPDGHADYTVETCTACHETAGEPASPTPTPAGSGTDAQAGDETPSAGEVPAVVPHDTGQGMNDCLQCHGVGGGALSSPEDHAGYSGDSCLECHQTAD